MNPRALAIEILARVEATDAYLNRVLEEKLASAPAHAARDAAFVTELCYGTTRRRLTLDAALIPRLDRRLETLEDRVLAALRVGVYQAFFMRVPVRAAVAETVEALKEMRLSRATGFVNAVLRKVAALPSLPLPPPPPDGDLALHLSVKESHPLWLVQRWLTQHGQERTESMLAADNQPPALTLRANSTRTTRDVLVAELSEMGLKVEPAKVSPDGITLQAPGKLETVFGYAEGLWQVQDEAAQQVVPFAALPEGARVWDVCAAPGGKSCQLAERHTVLSTDLHAHKLSRIESEAKRLGLRERLTLLAHDATTPLPASHHDFDAILLDAPCTGLGTLRRHPELRYRRLEADIARLGALQAQLLDSVCVRVKPGGLLVYAVCSPEPEEGSLQTERFLTRHPEFVQEPADQVLHTFPGPEGWDGFFAARLRRRVA